MKLEQIRKNIKEGKYNSKFIAKDATPEKWEKYRNKKLKHKNQFQNDLETVFGLSNNWKKDLLFNLAWEHGHSNGWWEVVIYYQEFSELLI